MMEVAVMNHRNSSAIRDPFLATLSLSDNGLFKVLKEFMWGGSVSGAARDAEDKIITGILEQCESSVSGPWLVAAARASGYPAEVATQVDHAQRRKHEAAILLLREWLADESGYDEAAWPIVKKAVEENRPSSRRRFGA